jgi:DNA-binding transcriptional LysR family regulator
MRYETEVIQRREVKPHDSPLVDVSARQIRAFTTVASTLSYAEAAELLHYTEPGVYAQVKRLETVLGCRLFERHGRGVCLTAEGTALLPACRSTLSEIDRIEGVRQRITQARRIAIAAGPVTGSYLLPALIRAFSAHEPEILVDLLTAPTDDVMQMVATGSADFGLCGSLDSLPVPRHIRLTHWLEEPFSLSVTGATEAQLIAPVVVYSIAKALGPVNLLRDKFAAAGVAEWETRFLASADAVKGACMAGLGYALLPSRATILERQAGALSDVIGFSGSIVGHVWICEPEAQRMNDDARLFLKYLHDNDRRLARILTQS